MIKQILDLLKTYNVLSLQDISLKLNIDENALNGIMQTLVNKNKVTEIKPGCSGCSGNCSGCNSYSYYKLNQ